MVDNVHAKKTDSEKKNISQRGWLEFRQSGLLFLVNQFLHIFGWCIVYQFLDETKDTDNSEPSNVFVARTIFRGFGNKAQDHGYKNISKYMADNAEDLLKEVNE